MNPLPTPAAPSVDYAAERLDLFMNANVGMQVVTTNGKMLLANAMQRRLWSDVGVSDSLLEHGTVQALVDPRAWSELLTPGAQSRNRVLIIRNHDRLARWIVDARTVGNCIMWVSRPILDGFSPGRPDDAVETWMKAWSETDVKTHIAEITADDVHSMLELINQFFSAVPIGVHQVSVDGVMVRANDEQLDMLDHCDDPGGFIGRGAETFFPDAVALDELANAFMTTGMIVNYPTVISARDGEEVPVTVYSTVISGATDVGTRCLLFYR